MFKYFIIPIVLTLNISGCSKESDREESEHKLFMNSYDALFSGDKTPRSVGEYMAKNITEKLPLGPTYLASLLKNEADKANLELPIALRSLDTLEKMSADSTPKLTFHIKLKRLPTLKNKYQYSEELSMPLIIDLCNSKLIRILFNKEPSLIYSYVFYSPSGGELTRFDVHYTVCIMLPYI